MLLVLFLFVSFLLLMLLGMPIAFAVGFSSLISIICEGSISLMLIPQKMFNIIDSFVLLAIPLFILTGELLSISGVTNRITRFSTALVGRFRGGLGMAATVSCMIFAGISGSAVADTSAIGSMMIPSMLKRAYKPGLVSAIVASGGCIGPIIPPSILMVVYASISSGVSVGALFKAGIIPGIFLGIGFMIITYFFALRDNYGKEKWQGLKCFFIIFKEALLTLFAPLIIIGGIISGVFTATEAGAIAAGYSFFLGSVIYKTLDIKKIEIACLRTAKLTSVVVMIIASCGLFSWVLSFKEIPKLVAKTILICNISPNLFMLYSIFILLIAGCFIEVLAAALIFVPVLAPIGAQLGFNDVHFSLTMILALVIGNVTPPVGVLLYVSTSLAKTTLSETLKYIFPYIFIMLIVLFVYAYMPR